MLGMRSLQATLDPESHTSYARGVGKGEQTRGAPAAIPEPRDTWRVETFALC